MSTKPEPFAWYSPRHGDTITDKQKTERAAYLPLDAAAYSVPLFTGAPVADDGCISVQEAWEAAGGNPGMKASKSDLLDALGMLDKVCDEADTAPVSPASVGWPDFVRRTNG